MQLSGTYLCERVSSLSPLEKILIVPLFHRFFIAQSYTGHICFLAWASGTVSQTPAKRAVALALMNSVSSVGNVFGS